jgi:hypothetical protein
LSRFDTAYRDLSEGLSGLFSEESEFETASENEITRMSDNVSRTQQAGGPVIREPAAIESFRIHDSKIQILTRENVRNWKIDMEEYLYTQGC